MGETINFGIDLGTTNSVLAVLADGRPQIIRNNHQEELTPSVVAVDRNGGIEVGRPARATAERRPKAAAREFKRKMGTDHTYVLAGKTMTPEELSAEVLKVLRACAQVRFGVDLTATVITVPAMFDLSANEATIRAARLAGFTQAPVLPEPIAAALAYGFQEADTEGYWLTYDLGGGTFDVALVGLRAGRLQVVDHTGDEYLGGKDFDHLLIDYVVGLLRQDYVIGGQVRDSDPRYGDLYPKLKRVCEDARIRLSQADTVVIDDFYRASDDQGQEIDTYIELSRHTLESLATPLVARTTRLSLDLLARNNLDPRQVQRVIMVGGPTYTPLVQRLVRQELGIPLETRIDPMTVVAQGAAVFAGSIVREGSASTFSFISDDDVPVVLKYEPVSSDTDALVGGRVEAKLRRIVSVQVERLDRSWGSGRIQVTDGRFVTRVPLRERQENPFALRAFDDSGLQCRVVPDRFIIRHGLAVDDPPLSRSIGVAVDRGTAEAFTEILLPRGTRLPAKVTHTLRTTCAVGPGLQTAVSLHIVEGEAERAARNGHVGFIRLNAATLDRILPTGSEVELTLSVDTSRALKASAFVPVLDETWKMEIADWKQAKPIFAILQQQLHEEQERLEKIGDVASLNNLQAMLVETEQALKEGTSGDSDALRGAQKRLHKLQAAVDSAESAAELPLLRAQWQDLLPKAQRILDEDGGQPGRQRLSEIEREGLEAVAKADVPRLRQRVDQLQELYWGTLMAQDGWWVGFYQHLVEREPEMLDHSTARVLIRDGRAALNRQDFEALRQICRRLWELLGNARGSTRGLPDVNVRSA